MGKRASGVLLHITSLPSAHGIGDLGPEAFRFADFLEETHQSFWQVLPITPTATHFGNSPYAGPSAFAGNTLLVSPDRLVEEGLLEAADLAVLSGSPVEKVDYDRVARAKAWLLRAVVERHGEGLSKDEGFKAFCRAETDWLDDHALFTAVKEALPDGTWSDWEPGLRDREERPLEAWRDRLAGPVEREKLLQYLFFRQWTDLRRYCGGKGIGLVGDMPIYVNDDSSDVWAHPGNFRLDAGKRPAVVAGVPPDYFSETGQRWGNPVYDWGALKETGYAWWVRRVDHALRLFGRFRLDHFRGFVAYWEIPSEERTAVRGRWVEGPGLDLFRTFERRFDHLPLIAEDLGVITPDVKQVREALGFPGMKVLLFAFGEGLPTHPYAPHNFPTHCVAYAGTHDNNTIRGWFREEAGPEEKRRFFAYIGREAPEEEVPWEMMRLALLSVADLAVVTMQDLLGLAAEARMNRPSTTTGNWAWRFTWDQVTPVVRKRLAEMTTIYGRG